MTIGERIKERRVELNLSADEVAAKIGKNRATVYRYEKNNIKDMPTNVLEDLAKVLETTPSYLMGWTEDSYEELDLFEYALSIMGWSYESFSECNGNNSVCKEDSMGEQCSNCKYLLTYYYLKTDKKYYKITEAEFQALSQCLLPYLRIRLNEVISGKIGLSKHQYEIAEGIEYDPEDPYVDSELCAAHKRTDIPESAEETRADLDMMSDDNF